MATMMLCAIAIRAEVVAMLAWALLVLNGIGAVLAAVSEWLDERS